MKNVKHINFVSDKKLKRAIIYYDNGKQLEVSRKAGEYAVRQYAKDHNIDDYLQLIDMKFVNVYALNSADRKSRELTPDLMLRELQRRNDLQAILSSEVTAINFLEDKENDNLYSKVSFKYTFQDGDKKRTVDLEETVDVSEAIDLLISYANENKIDNIEKVFAKDGIANVQEDLVDYFEEEIIPKIQVKMKVEKSKAAQTQNQTNTTTSENNKKKNNQTQNNTKNTNTTQNNKESEENKTSNNQTFGLNNNSIGKIVKYSFIDEYDEIRTCAVIFYTDGTVRNVSNTEADELFAKFAFQYGVKEIGLRNKELGFYDEVNGKTLVEEFTKYRKEAMEGNQVLNDYLFNNKEKNSNSNSINPIAVTNTGANNKNNANSTNKSTNNKNNANGTSKSTNNKNNANSTNKGTNNKNNTNGTNKGTNKSKKAAKKTKGKKPSYIKKLINKFMKFSLVQRIAIGLGTLVFMIGGFKLGQKLFTHNVPKDNDTTTEANSNSNTNNIDVKEDNNTREDFSEYTYQQLAKKCKKNIHRKEAIGTMYDFINNYNHTIGYTYKETKSDIRAAHTMDEVAAMYLVYNEIDPDIIHEIFKTTELNAKDLREKLISAQYQDTLAHNIQTRTLDKADLFTKQADKDLYNKYEKLFIDMNESFDDEKKNFKEKFYDMVREDLPGMATYNYKNVDSSKVIIKEFMDAMENVNIETKNSLSNQEKNYINGIMANVVDKKLQTIATRQAARNIEMTMDYNSQITDQEPYYSDFKNAIVAELTNENAYYTTDENRDISYYKTFAKNTMRNSDKKEEQNTQEVANNNTNTNSQANSNNNSNNYNTTQTANTSSSATNSYANSNASAAANTNSNTNAGTTSTANTNNNSSNSMSTPTTPNNQTYEGKMDEEIIIEDEMLARVEKDIIDVEPEKFVNELEPERTLDDMDLDHHPYPPLNEDSSFDVDTGIDEITPDDILPEEKPSDNIEDLIPDEIKDFTVVEDEIQPEDNQVDINDNVVNIDQDKVDENGNLNDQYTNVSTDQNVQENQMSNEEIVDEIIRQMEQDASEYINENNLGDFGKTL